MYQIRFRDVAIPIRAECVAYLGDWVIEYPVLYSKNNCLRMLGWALSDRAPEVRISAVEALRKVYCEATLASQIDMFTEAFKGTYFLVLLFLFIYFVVFRDLVCEKLLFR